MPPDAPPLIYVIAGVNGAGKSSIQGAAIIKANARYYNPDEAAAALRVADPVLTREAANSVAWHNGVELLKKAVKEKLNFSFESTLAGNTIPKLLRDAAHAGRQVRIWYIGLSSPELHIARVLQRVRRGGHSIPEDVIRHRYERSQSNLIDLIPHLTGLKVFDNSAEADPAEGKAPKPKLLLHLESGRILTGSHLTATPAWAKPIVAAAIKHAGEPG
ncbi:MAG TPA: zeta toxin family protein [Pyrinomonadaceae bacterium]|nr:zeta toxin family protein [Pyrinomonadaceae bacterium]